MKNEQKMKSIRKTLAALGVALCAALAGHGNNLRAEDAVTLDPALPAYAPVSGISGNLNSIGSDTLNNLMTFWAESFAKQYPNVKIQIEGKGSSTAPPALIAGTAQLGPMSRKMKSEEVDAFEKKYGYKPRMIAVALDGLAVFVHKDNPLDSLTMQQADAIFSSTKKRGGKDVTKWGDLGLTGDWANRPVSLYGRNSASGTYGFFKEHVLDKGDYKSAVKEQPGSASVVQGVENDLGGIGYSGIGYRTSGVKALSISFKKGAVPPTQANVNKMDYPISRYLYVYINVDPVKGCDPLVKEFIKFVLSAEGQQICVKDGYFPVSAKKAQESLESVQ